MRYLITWKLALGREQLNRISSQPALLQRGIQRGLLYVKHLMKGGRHIELYRIMPIRALTQSVRQEPEGYASEPLSGIAIVEAESIEDVKRMVEGMQGSTAEGFSVIDFLEYEIKPLRAIGRERGE